MKTLITLLFICFCAATQAQTLWEVEPKTIPNEIDQVDTVKYISGRVIFGSIAQLSESDFEFYIAFHRPDRSILRTRNFSKASYTENLIAKGVPTEVTQQTASWAWSNVIPDLLSTDLVKKRVAVIALLESYGYVLKQE